MLQCPKCNTLNQEDAKYCASCGNGLTTEQVENPVHQPVSAQANQRRLHCPSCGGYAITPVVETSTDAAFTASNRRLAATTVSNTHRNYWMCSQCGTKFRNIQNLEEEIRKISKYPKVITVITILAVIILFRLIMEVFKNPYISFVYIPAIFIAFITSVVLFCFIFVYRNKIKKLTEELKYLKENCF